MTSLSNFRFNKLSVFGLLLPLVAIVFASRVSFASPTSTNSPANLGSTQQTPALVTSASPNDSEWMSGFHLPGTNGIVHATALDSKGHLYIGGQFSVVNDIDAINIARWDGTKWHAVDTGMNGAVYALAFGSDGTLYAGGTFTSAGSCTTNCKWLAAWNGTDWSGLGTGLDGLGDSAVRALTIDNNQLYVGGSFAVAGSCITCKSVARWNGTTWSPLNQGTSGTVFALAADGTGNVYVGGNFFGTDGCAECFGIGRWNGTSWHALETGVGGTVYALAIDTNHNVYVGGDFFFAGSCFSCFLLSKWNGTTWSDIGYDGAFTNQVTELAFNASGTLYVYGESSPNFGDLFTWNGATWKKLTDYPIDVNALVINSSGKVYIGGGFNYIGDCFSGCASIVQLSGSTWNPLGSFGRGPTEFVTSLLTDQNGDVIVAGYFESIGACTTCSYIARWDGSNWSPLGQPPFSPAVMALDSSGNLYIAQSWQPVFMWNGTDWSPIGDDFDDFIAGNPYDMIVDDNDTLYIAGDFFMPSCFPDCVNIAQWDGMTWLGLDWGILQPVHTLAVDSNNTLYAGGQFTGISGSTTDCPGCNYVAKWNGTNWTSLASTPNNTVRTMMFDSDDMLYAGGDFTVAGTCFSNCQSIAMWNGSAWSGLGGGMNNRVQTLAMDANGALYAGGTFTTAGTCVSGCTNIAGWDGSAWHDLDNGIDGEVTALVVNRQGLVHASGWFSHAGDKISRYFAVQSSRIFLPFIAIAE